MYLLCEMDWLWNGISMWCNDFMSQSSWKELEFIWFHGCVSVFFSLPFFCMTSTGNPRLLILFERKPWKVSDWSQFSPEGAALHSFRGVAQPPHTAGGRTQPHRSSLCSGPNRWMTLFFLSSSPTPIPKRNGKQKKKKKREIHIIIIIIQYFF